MIATAGSRDGTKPTNDAFQSLAQEWAFTSVAAGPGLPRAPEDPGALAGDARGGAGADRVARAVGAPPWVPGLDADLERAAVPRLEARVGERQRPVVGGGAAGAALVYRDLPAADVDDRV